MPRGKGMRALYDVMAQAMVILYCCTSMVTIDWPMSTI